MAYPDLPPSPTFWRCPNCGNEASFRAIGSGHIQCPTCTREWTAAQLKAAHAGHTAPSRVSS
jgi:uncharacterized Zn ribbon protein